MIRKALTVIAAVPTVALLTAGTAMAQGGSLLTVDPAAHDGSLLSVSPELPGASLGPAGGPANASPGGSFNEAEITQNNVHALINVVGPLVDARCAAALAAATIGTDYAACDTAPVHNERHEAPNGGLVGLS